MLSILLSDPQVWHVLIGVAALAAGWYAKHSSSPVAGRLGTLLSRLAQRRQEIEAQADLHSLLRADPSALALAAPPAAPPPPQPFYPPPVPPDLVAALAALLAQRQQQQAHAALAQVVGGGGAATPPAAAPH